MNEKTVKTLRSTRKQPSHELTQTNVNGKSTLVEFRTRDLEVPLTNSKFCGENSP